MRKKFNSVKVIWIYYLKLIITIYRHHEIRENILIAMKITQWISKLLEKCGFLAWGHQIKPSGTGIHEIKGIPWLSENRAILANYNDIYVFTLEQVSIYCFTFAFISFLTDYKISLSVYIWRMLAWLFLP